MREEEACPKGGFFTLTHLEDRNGTTDRNVSSTSRARSRQGKNTLHLVRVLPPGEHLGGRSHQPTELAISVIRERKKTKCKLVALFADKSYEIALKSPSSLTA